MSDISRKMVGDKDDLTRRHAGPHPPTASVGHDGGKPPIPGAAGPASETRGRVWRIVRWVDANKGAFVISRLILQTGIKLRTFEAEMPDDPRVLARLWHALDALLSPAEREALKHALQDAA